MHIPCASSIGKRHQSASVIRGEEGEEATADQQILVDVDDSGAGVGRGKRGWLAGAEQQGATPAMLLEQILWRLSFGAS